MADDSMDGVEHGYVDDDIDLDDDVESDVPITPTLGGPSDAARSSVAPSTGRGASDAGAGGENASLHPPRDPRDYTLRTAGSAERTLVVARFLNPCPDLSPPVRMRALREREGDKDERLEAIKADRKQHMYYKSHIGRNRRSNTERQGYTVVPDRERKRWRVDVFNPDEAISKPPAPEAPGEDEEEKERPKSVFDASSGHTRQYEGTFEGKTSSRYAMIVVDDRTRTASVTPVGPYSWFSFRQKRGRRVTAQRQMTTEGAERAIERKAERGVKQLAKFHERSELAQQKSELGAGSLSGLLAKKENAMIGIFRGSGKQRESREGGEGLDFDQEFDNDDLAQVEKEEVEKPSEVSEFQRPDYKKKFNKMIKDELVESPAGVQSPSTSRPGSPGSPGSESEDEADSKTPSNSRPQSPSQVAPPSHGLPPKGPGSANRPPLPGGGASVSVAAAAAVGAPSASRPGSVRMSTPVIASPSPSSAPSTPLREQYAHLLPAPGAFPTEKHVRDVLKAMTEARHPNPLSLKEFTHLFERHTPQHKKNLAGIMKRVAKLVELPPGSKTYYVSLAPEKR